MTPLNPSMPDHVRPIASFLVVDCAFNRENGYGDKVGKVYKRPPGYAAVRRVSA